MSFSFSVIFSNKFRAIPHKEHLSHNLCAVLLQVYFRSRATRLVPDSFDIIRQRKFDFYNIPLNHYNNRTNSRDLKNVLQNMWYRFQNRAQIVRF